MSQERRKHQRREARWYATPACPRRPLVHSRATPEQHLGRREVPKRCRHKHCGGSVRVGAIRVCARAKQSLHGRRVP
eukprot:2896495-Prymnesium_polylepis.2